MEIKKLTLDPLSTNCYLIWDEETLETIIIDASGDTEEIVQQIKNLNLSPRYVLATHGHFDHVLGVTDIKSIFNIPFLIHQEDTFLLKDAEKIVESFLGIKIKPIPAPDKFIKEGEEIRFGKESLKVLETPGHTPGSVSFYRPGFLFCGDLIFSKGVGRTDFPYSSEEKLYPSIKRIFDLDPETIVYPGHGESFKIEEALYFEMFKEKKNLITK